MKVYIKKGEKQSIILGTIAVLMFLGMPSILIYLFLKDMKSYSFLEALNEHSSSLVFAIPFFIIGLYLFYFFIKPAKYFRGRLIRKTYESYKNKKIVYMNFFAGNDAAISNYRCFTYDDNDFEVGKEYNLKIREFNWEIKEVNEIGLEDKYKTPKVSSITFKPVFLVILLFFLGQIILSLIGIKYYSEYKLSYIIWAIIHSIIFIFVLKMALVNKEVEDEIKNNVEIENPELLENIVDDENFDNN